MLQLREAEERGGRLAERPPRARTFRPELPATIDEALAKAMAPERQARTGSAGRFAEEMKRAMEQKG